MSNEATFRKELKNAKISSTFPGKSAFNSPTPRNKRLTVYPSVITVPENSDQVAKIVEICKKYRRRVVPLSGGHSAIANSIGGYHGAVVIYLRKLKDINFDSSTKRITFGTGNKLKQVIKALKENKRAFAHGVCDDVGLGGHPSFGGFGFASRMWGLNCDAIYSMTVVTDDGTQKVCSATSNKDLFWAMRGAAPSFAIATSITYNTYEVPKYTIDYSYKKIMDYDEATHTIDAFQWNVDSAYYVPKELGLQFRVDKGDEADKLALSLSGFYYGDKTKWESYLEPFLAGLLGATEITRLVDSGDTPTPLAFPAADPNTFFTKPYAVTIEGDYFRGLERAAADVTLTGDSITYAKILNELEVEGTNDSKLSYIRGVISPRLSQPPPSYAEDLESELEDSSDENPSASAATYATSKLKASPSDETPLASFYTKSWMAPILKADAVTAFMKYAAYEGYAEKDLSWYAALKLLGGKQSVVPNQPDTSFGWRETVWIVEFDASTRVFPQSGVVFPEKGYTFLDNFAKTISENMETVFLGAYPGFSDDRLQNFNLRYYADNLERLQQIKASSATNDIFVYPQSI